MNKVGPDMARERLDRFLSQSIKELSRVRIKSLIESGSVLVGQADNFRTVTEASYRVKSGELIQLIVPAPKEALPEPQSMNLNIAFEDDHLVVLDKPAGLVVHPAPGNPDRTLVNALLAHCGNSLSGVGGVRRPGIVHRLDKNTSGLLVAAKHDAAHVGLSKLFASHDIHRRYRAIIWGRPIKTKGRIEGNIGRNPNNRKTMAVVPRGGKPAITHYTLIEAFNNIDGYFASLVDCRLETGRTHQIRVHLASIGHPVLGDPIYGGIKRRLSRQFSNETQQILRSFNRQALHAVELGFRHPIDGTDLMFYSLPPHDMKEIECLFRDSVD